jgi:hypothetical protein
MGAMKPTDQFTSTEKEVEVDEATLAAIDRAIKAAEEGRVVPLEEVRPRMREWHTKSSSRHELGHLCDFLSASLQPVLRTTKTIKWQGAANTAVVKSTCFP